MDSEKAISLLSPTFNWMKCLSLIPCTFACLPINERLSAADVISQPASIMLSVILLSIILQSAPMEAYGPIVEFEIFALACTKDGAMIFVPSYDSSVALLALP